jgi:hypothetical protein
MFNRVPVVINSFNLELRQGIDYISTKQGNTPGSAVEQNNYLTAAYDPETLLAQQASSGEPQTWAPTISNISVLVTPVYSRESIKNFSMKKFVNGELNGKGNEVGFI